MKKTASLLGLLLVFLIYAHTGGAEPSAVTLTYYYSPHCRHCLKIKSTVIPALQKKYKDRIRLIQKDTSDVKTLGELDALCRQYHVDAFVPALYVALSPEEKYLLIGTDNIENNVFALLDTSLGETVSGSRTPVPDVPAVIPPPAPEEHLIRTFKDFSFLTIVGAGLLDGINPCAFAVIILFISFLSVYGYERRQMVLIGSFYIFAVFITYLCIGLGIFNFLYSLRFFYYLIKAFYIGLIALCFFLGILSLRDFFTVRRRGAPEEMALQLPAAVKKRIQFIFAQEYRQKTGKNMFRLAGGAFTVGIVVSLLEAVCTGQIYVPVIAFILKVPELRTKALGYLLLYNSMFILPLIVIFILALIGVASSKMNNFLKSHLGMMKVLLAVLFFVLGIFILLTEFF